jgi:hypothetical protein
MTTTTLLLPSSQPRRCFTNTERLALAGFLAGQKTKGSEVALAGLVQILRHLGGWESTNI